MMVELDLMMKCDMCYDRTSAGLKPMCAAVCPSVALHYTTREEMETLRPRSRPVNQFQFGGQRITTKVQMMVPRESPVENVDVTAAMHDRPAAGPMMLNLLSDVFPLPMSLSKGGSHESHQRRAAMSLSKGESSREFPDGRPEEQQPRWWRDFPVDLPEDDLVARREFTKFLVLTSGAFVAGQCWIGLMSSARADRPLPEMRIAADGDVKVNAVVEFRYPTEDDPCLLVRLPDRTLVAYSQKCTHLSSR